VTRPTTLHEEVRVEVTLTSADCTFHALAVVAVTRPTTDHDDARLAVTGVRTFQPEPLVEETLARTFHALASVLVMAPRIAHALALVAVSGVSTDHALAVLWDT
jgi:hypothetical protein